MDPDNLESLYKSVHAAIRADPEIKLTEKHVPSERKRYVILLSLFLWCLIQIYWYIWCLLCILNFFFPACSYKMKKLTYDERKASLIARLNALNNDEDDEE